MTRSLVICEKPSVATDVAKALAGTHRFTRTPWGFEAPAMLIAPAAGHLVESLPPERYNEAWKEWSYEQLPILPERFLYQPRDQRAGKRLRQLAALINDPTVTELINAGDAGREGELIFKLIVQYARLKTPKPIRRAWFSSMTPAAIQAAFANLRPDRDLVPLELAARCRAEADWVVGMNATRAATCTLGGGRTTLSVGRVQTPTLALVVRRDLEIEQFRTSDFFRVKAGFANDAGAWPGHWRSSRDGNAHDRFDDRADAVAVAARVKAAGRGRIDSVEVRTEQVAPPKLYDLTDLQRDANRRYGLSAAKTLEAAQACYEEHKVLSYPRTSSRYLTTDMRPEVPKLVARVAAADRCAYQALCAAVTANGCDPTPIINDAKVEDHHGLVPTDANHDLSKLSPDQRRIYDLVVRRFLAALLPPQRLERTVVWTAVDTTAGTDWFRTAARAELDAGWRVALPTEAAKTSKKSAAPDEGDDTDSDDEVTTLPALTPSNPATVTSCDVTTHQTKPPAAFSEASLLGVMATAGRLVDDDEMADAMRDSGLGTPATRAATVETLLSRNYLERSGRKLVATAKGRGLIIALGDHVLTRADLTGDWERRLRLIERSDPDAAPGLRDAFGAAIRAFVTDVVTGFAGTTPEQMAAGRIKIAPCPVPGCDGTVVEGRKAWGCDTYRSKDEPGCGFLVWKERDGKKVTAKELTARIADVASGAATVAPRTERTVLGGCPSAGCDGTIVERPKSWGCTSWRSPKDTGCGYVIWKQDPDGAVVDEARARDLLAAGATNAKAKAAGFAPCPHGDGELVDRGRFYGCTSWSPKKAGCGTTLWKTDRNGHEFTVDELHAKLAETAAAGPPTKPAKGTKKATSKRKKA